jgi:heme-degrading monooxygenase HmoA
MLALFFEVLPRPGHEATYLDMAARLRPALDASGGMTFLDRSRSALRPAWFLSHQFWADEASMARWRTNETHHRAQACGRAEVLADYRLRVAPVIASATAGAATTQLTQRGSYHARGSKPDRFVVSVVSHGAVPALAGETFASVYDPNISVQIVPVVTEAEGLTVLATAAAHPGLLHARLCLISRDYGMFDRAEAPQYFEPVTLS